MTNYRIVCKTNRVGKNFYLIQYQIFWFWWRYLSYMLGHDYSEYYIAETINEAECKIWRISYAGYAFGYRTAYEEMP